MDDDSAVDELIESELSSENDFESWRCKCSEKKLRNHFYCKILCTALVFFCSFTTFVHYWEGPMNDYVFTFFFFVDYVPSLL